MRDMRCPAPYALHIQIQIQNSTVKTDDVPFIFRRIRFTKGILAL